MSDWLSKFLRDYLEYPGFAKEFDSSFKTYQCQFDFDFNLQQEELYWFIAPPRSNLMYTETVSFANARKFYKDETAFNKAIQTWIDDFFITNKDKINKRLEQIAKNPSKKVYHDLSKE